MAIVTIMQRSNAILRKTDEFSSVFSFRKRVSANYMAMHYQPNNHVHARLGLVVSKKIAKSSVARNYMRRVLRECFRLQFVEIASVDLIIRVQKKFDRRAFAEVNAEFNTLIRLLNKRCVTQISPKDMQSNTTA
jgi:ribonuclease P protein component